MSVELLCLTMFNVTGVYMVQIVCSCTLFNFLEFFLIGNVYTLTLIDTFYDMDMHINVTVYGRLYWHVCTLLNKGCLFALINYTYAL